MGKKTVQQLIRRKYKETPKIQGDPEDLPKIILFYNFQIIPTTSFKVKQLIF
jgi:hypothetical protein